MEEKVYKYSGYKSRGGAQSMRPLILAKVASKYGTENLMCLIDSGSDHTLIDAEYAEVLGIDLRQCKKLDMGGVIGDEVQASIAEIRMEFDTFDEIFTIQAKFVAGMSTDVILGQSDFFELFKVRFERKRHRFCLIREASI